MQKKGRLKSCDRVWQRLKRYCKKYCSPLLCRGEPTLDGIPSEDVSLIIWSFLKVYREAKLTQSKEIIREHVEPLSGVTIREATSSLAKMSNDNFGWSPIHDQGDIQQNHMTFERDQLLPFDNVSPNKKIQRAITPELLYFLAYSAPLNIMNIQEDNAIDLIIGAYLFVNRLFDFTKTPSPGKRKSLFWEGSSSTK